MAICGNRNWLSGLLGVFSITGVLAHVIFCCENHALAQITPDGTLGDRSSKVTPNVNIKGLTADRIDGGAIRGANLFHSFREFNVGESQRVYFANPTGISNILTRVTGSNISNILGTLGVDGGANLFFINPNGILFGNNGRLDVAGSFVASTANSFVFGNGLEFSATNPQTPSPLLTVNPSALLFNQLQAGRIENRSIAPAGIDPAGFNASGLRVGDGKSLLLVGGNVIMDGGQLNAYGGRVEFGGLAAPGNVNLLFNGDNLSLKFPLNVTRASVSLTNQARVYVEAAGGGDITINARNIDILGGSQLSAGIASGLGQPEATAGDITLNATGEIKVADSGSRIRNFVSKDSKGNSGNITIDSGDFSLEDSAFLSASTSGVGNAGNVTVSAKNAISLAYAYIYSTVLAGGVGKGGNININATTLSLTDGAQLLTSTRSASATQPGGRGDAGNVNVKVTGAVDIAGVKNDFESGIGSFVQTGTIGNGGNIFIDSGDFSLSDGAQLSASTSGVGNAGNITVNAKNAVDLAGNAAIFSTVSAGGVGKGGNININATTLSLTDGAQLLTVTRGASATQPAGRGNAGNVNIKVTGTVDIAGEKNDFFSVISSNVETGTVGNGGNIFIDSGDFSLRDGAQLQASTSGVGNAGNVTVSAKNAVDLADNAYIFSIVEAGGVGKGGNININATTLSLTDGAQLLTITRGVSASQPAGQGDTSNVNIKVTDAVDIADVYSGISSNVETGAIGNGGNIFIDSSDFSLRDGAQLQALTSGVGNAGNVTVNAKNAVDLAGSNTSIFSTVEAGGVGKGGNVNINATTLSLTDGAQLLTITRGASANQPAGQGDAGNVNIKVTGAVDIAGQKNDFESAILSYVQTGTVGNGGNIFIDSGDFSLSDGAQLSASTSGVGNAGNVTVRAKNVVTVSGTSQESGNSSGLFTFTDSNSTGIGGDITVNTNIFRISNGALLDARTRNDQSGGDITVNANVFEALNGGQLTTTTSSNGRAGKITVNADDKLIISGIDPSYSDRITKFPDNVGNIGANSGLFVSSTGSGITGDIELNSNLITLDNQGKLNAESASGNGGNINLNSDLLLLRRNSQISTNAGTEKLGGNGGNIKINSRFIVAVPKENSDISANAFTGIGGRVDITTNGIFGILSQKSLTENSDITASSELGVSGEVTINSPDTDPSRGLIELPSNLVDVSQQIAQGCTPRGGQNASRFIATGRGGLPQSPNEPLRGRAVITGWVDLPPQATHTVTDKSSTASMTKSSDPIVEAQGWILDGNGDIMLVAKSPQSFFIPSAMSCNQ
ncbi:filamentous hemagglutinin N-terminal domain-containing protein [Nostoc cf. edaphicum LEGE 07299]|uniref:Filamentous hemagglutinin N-terminal domain-containing protein n=1 Tax=Nostoc cf. edaphicum LEGE 07299 TaxID=2777974 RepID=A0ABR9U1I5_9NOSO|nr:filamentous hemagglutinin N-terminal domain-containing protein [Nostoc edaphicum]MBE9106513.1 filamentous hemagglutinin N-terminal domain-containing protein [Nostoc cf. edaphicum LEGE 07299]